MMEITMVMKWMIFRLPEVVNDNMQEIEVEPVEFKTSISPFNWGTYFLEWMTPNLRQYLYKIPLPHAQKHFIEGLTLEYGIDVEESLEKAIKKYSIAAQADHPLALYKLAELELLEWKDGKRNDRDEEMYLRFRAYAYLTSSQDPKGLEIIPEITRYMRQYDPTRVKLGELFARLETKKDPIDLAYIKAKIGLLALDYEEVSRAVELLGMLVSKYRHSDAAFTMAVLHLQQNGIIEPNSAHAGEYFKICEAVKYYKAYNSIGQFLLGLGLRHEGMTLLQQAFNNGYYEGFPNILSTKFYELDKANQLFKLIDAYIPTIVTGNILSILNIFHIRCLSKLDPEYYNQQHDLIEAEIVTVVKEMYQQQRLKQIKNKDQFVMAYVLTVSLGYITKDYDQQDILIDEAFHETESVWLKRYCITNLMEVRRKRYQQDPTNQRLEVLKKTGCILANQHLSQLNNNQTASYFYYLAQIYNNGWGVQKSRVNYYLFLCKAAEWADTEVIGNLFLQYYKGNQAKQELSAITQLPQIAPFCKRVKQDLSENRTCDICYERTKEAFFHECHHYCCIFCYNLIIKEKGSCHMCRKPIQAVHLLSNVMKFE